MVPTRLAVVLAAFGLAAWLPLLAFALVPPLTPSFIPDTLLAAVGWLILGFDGGVFLLILADALLAWQRSRPGQLRIRRERPARLSLGVANDITITLENHNRLPLRLL